MFTVKRIIALSLAVAVLAATAGAFLASSQNYGQALSANTTSQTESRVLADDLVADLNQDASSMDEQLAYQKGYEEGLRANQSSSYYSPFRATPTTRVVYRNSGRSYSHASTTYYQPRKRSFWDKHRDKLTVAGSAGAGALIGGLAGGKKWAGIGALIGAGGGALYTYKLRKRDRRQ